MADELALLEIRITHAVQSDRFGEAEQPLAAYVESLRRRLLAPDMTTADVRMLESRSRDFLERLSVIVATARSHAAAEIDRLWLRAQYNDAPGRYSTRASTA